MNRAEALTVDRIAGKIDRANAKAAREARKADIEAKARKIASGFVALNDAERADFAKALIRYGKDELMEAVDPECAVQFLSHQAHDAAKGILPGKIARAAAEQAFAKMGRGE